MKELLSKSGVNKNKYSANLPMKEKLKNTEEQAEAMRRKIK